MDRLTLQEFRAVHERHYEEIRFRIGLVSGKMPERPTINPPSFTNVMKTLGVK